MRDVVLETQIDQWEPELLEASICSVFGTLSYEEAVVLNKAHPYTHGTLSEEDEEKMSGFEQWFDAAIKEVGGHGFVKLGARSPKDSYIVYENGYEVTTGSQALALLLDSERIAEELRWGLQREPYVDIPVVIREFIDIQPDTEFRVFVKSGEVIGISQYFYRDSFGFGEDVATLGLYSRVIEEHVNHYIPHLPNPDMVVDVFVTWIGTEECRQWIAPLIEINPLNHDTDPCLFTWDEIDEASEYLGFRVVEE